MLKAGPEYHCAKTNPEMWDKFSYWFFDKHHKWPRPWGWTEEAVSAWKGEFDVT